jgi:hypothetical protein
MKWATGILRAVGLGGDRTGEEEAKAAAAKEERRRTFGKLYEHMGHHGAVVSSTVRTTPPTAQGSRAAFLSNELTRMNCIRRAAVDCTSNTQRNTHLTGAR